MKILPHWEELENLRNSVLLVLDENHMFIDKTQSVKTIKM